MSANSAEDVCNWHVRLFGGVAIVSAAGLVIPITRKKPAELLGYLALNASRTHARNKLADLIWGETEVADARTRLRQEISRLRTLMPSGCDVSSLLRITPDSCQLNPTVFVDAVRFQECCAAANRTVATDPNRRLTSQVEAQALYLGDFMPGIETPWVIAERVRLRQLYDTEVSQLVGESNHVSTRQVTIHQPQPVSSLLSVAQPPTQSVPPPDVETKHNIGSANTPPLSRKMQFSGGLLLMLLFLGIGGAYLGGSRPLATAPNRIKPAVRTNSHRWAYSYTPRSGEKPNSEGKAIASDASGIYVTGLIQTDKDDVDILTVKLSHVGKLLWADRFSSPEHDCDRAFSVCLDGSGQGGIYVGGETYVPAGHGVAEGWRLALLHYDARGNRLWERRLNTLMHNIGECVQVCSDSKGGCYIAGTSVECGEGNESILVVHYNGNGSKLWEHTIHEGQQTIFCNMVVGADGDLYLCGTSRESKSHGDALYKWVTARVLFTGISRWIQKEDGPSHSGGSVGRILLDYGGNVCVSGVFQRSVPGSNYRDELNLALQKYSPNGVGLWQRVDPKSGPSVIPQGLSVSINGSVALGGTEMNSDGKWVISTVRYDAFGHLTLSKRYQPLPGYKSAAMHDLNLFESDGFILVGELGINVGSIMRDECSLCILGTNADGDVCDPRIYESAPHTVNKLSAFLMCPDAIVTGQTGAGNGARSLMVVKY